MITRRETLRLIGASAATWPLLLHAQAKAKLPHIGYLSTGSLPINEAFLSAFKDGLREVGYVDGTNIAIDVRWAGKMASDFPRIAASMVQDNPSAIVTTCIPSTRAAKAATQTIPVVMSIDGDPVRAGAAARALGVQLLPLAVRGPEEFDGAFSTMIRERANALIVFPSPMVFIERRRIVDLAATHRLPSIYIAREFAELGGLIAYGASITDLNRRAASYVDKILKGVKPGDLPVEQPTKFELVINLRTAKALGITIPQALLLRADEVIQ